MRKTALIGTGAAVAVILVLAGITFAQAATAPAAGRGFGRRLLDTPFGRLITGRIGRAMVLASELKLTDDQRAQVRKVLVSHKSEVAAVIKPIIEKRRALRDAVTADKPDGKAIKSAAADLGTAIGDAAVLASTIRGELAKTLTPDQLKRLREFRAENDQALDGFLKDADAAP